MGILPILLIARSPHKGEDFAADAGAARLTVGHDARGGRDDGDAHPTEHLGELGAAGMDAPPPPGHPAEPPEAPGPAPPPLPPPPGGGGGAPPPAGLVGPPVAPPPPGPRAVHPYPRAPDL